jgi:hypothetical protein
MADAGIIDPAVTAAAAANAITNLRNMTLYLHLLDEQLLPAGALLVE